MALGTCHNKIPIYPMFYLLKGDYSLTSSSMSFYQLLCWLLLAAGWAWRIRVFVKGVLQNIGKEAGFSDF